MKASRLSTTTIFYRERQKKREREDESTEMDNYKSNYFMMRPEQDSIIIR